MKSNLSSNNTLPSVRQVTSNKVNLILKSLNIKNVSGTDRIPTKVVTLVPNVSSTPLAIAITNILASSKFPDIDKTATVVPIDEKRDDKYDISNFRLVSLLSCFSKVYKKL